MCGWSIRPVRLPGSNIHSPALILPISKIYETPLQHAPPYFGNSSSEIFAIEMRGGARDGSLEPANVSIGLVAQFTAAGPDGDEDSPSSPLLAAPPPPTASSRHMTPNAAFIIVVLSIAVLTLALTLCFWQPIRASSSMCLGVSRKSKATADDDREYADYAGAEGGCCGGDGTCSNSMTDDARRSRCAPCPLADLEEVGAPRSGAAGCRAFRLSCACPRLLRTPTLMSCARLARSARRTCHPLCTQQRFRCASTTLNRS